MPPCGSPLMRITKSVSSPVSVLMPSSERALALQDTFERAIEGPDHHAGAYRDSGDHDEEAYLVHGAPEAAEPAGDEIADEAGAEPQSHHRRDHARRRDLRNQRQADGGEKELADGDDDEIGEQPPPTRRIAAGRPRRARHDQIEEGDAKAAERHLGDGRRLHSALLLPCPEPNNERRESENHERVEGLEPSKSRLRGSCWAGRKKQSPRRPASRSRQ